VIAVPSADLLYRAAKQHHRVGGFEIATGSERELDLARPELHLERAQWQPERFDGLPKDLEDLVIPVVARFAQELVTGGQQADLGRSPRLSRIGGCEVSVLNLENVAFDFEAGDVIEVTPVEVLEHAAAELAGAERHHPAGGEVEVAQQPAAVRRPGQHLEARRIRHQQQIRGALHLGHVEAAAAGEDREYGAVRGILGEQARWRRVPVPERAVEFGGNDRLAAQHAMLIGKRQSHDAERLGLPSDFDRSAALLVGPQAVALDEAGHGTGRSAAQAEACRRRRSFSRQ